MEAATMLASPIQASPIQASSMEALPAEESPLISMSWLYCRDVILQHGPMLILHR